MNHRFGRQWYNFENNAEIFKAEKLYTAKLTQSEFEVKMIMTGVKFSTITDPYRLGLYLKRY